MHRMRSIVALGVALVAIAAGCGGDEGSEGPTGEEIVAQAADAFADTKSFHLVYDLVNAPPAGSGLRLTHANGDVEVSNGEQKGIEVAVAGTFSGIPLESELVIVEGDGFLKDPLTGAWRELDITQVPGAFDLLDGVPAVLRSVQDVERAGEEQVAGVAAYRLRGKVTARKLAAFLGNTPSDKLAPVELWIGQDDSLIRRIEVEGSVEEGEPDEVTRKVDLSEFGKSVHIERPTQ
jgi:hypothetical protein